MKRPQLVPAEKSFYKINNLQFQQKSLVISKLLSLNQRVSRKEMAENYCERLPIKLSGEMKNKLITTTIPIEYRQYLIYLL